MLAKTDNAAEIGVHVFERANLGKAPFRCIGMTEETFQAAPGAPVKAGGCCKYCGNGIRYVFHVRGSDGRTFGVGSDCVNRTGDAGLIKSFKSRPEVRKMNREKAAMRDTAKIAEWDALVSDPTNRATLARFTIQNWKGESEAWLGYAERAWRMCGASGRARYLAAAKKLLSSAVSS